MSQKATTTPPAPAQAPDWQDSFQLLFIQLCLIIRNTDLEDDYGMLWYSDVGFNGLQLTQPDCFLLGLGKRVTDSSVCFYIHNKYKDKISAYARLEATAPNNLYHVLPVHEMIARVAAW